MNRILLQSDGTMEENIQFHLKFLRDESPDATNKGETILWTHYEAVPQGPDKPGKYEITDIQVVGSYAIQITWKDGFDHGIYSWNLLEKWGEYWAIKNDLKENSIQGLETLPK